MPRSDDGAGSASTRLSLSFHRALQILNRAQSRVIDVAIEKFVDLGIRKAVLYREIELAQAAGSEQFGKFLAYVL